LKNYFLVENYKMMIKSIHPKESSTLLGFKKLLSIKRMKYYSPFLIIFIVLASVLSLAAEIEKYYGKIDPGDGHIYTCSGEIIRNDGKVTKTSYFYDENGKILLNEKVVFDEKGYKLINLVSEEPRYGRIQEIQRKGSQYIARYRKNSGEEFREYIINDQPLLLHSSNLPVYLSQNLNLIGESGHVCRLIIVPMKMEIEMIFKNKGIKNIDGHQCFEIQMDAANIFLKPLVKTHYFYYGTEAPHYLYHYIGTISLTNPNGDDIWGTISLTYE